MGVEYYVVDTANKTFYQLGKGGWYELSFEYMADPELFALHIEDACYSKSDEWARQYYDEQHWNWVASYVRERIVPDLIECFGNTPIDKLLIVNDCGDDLIVMRAKGYKFVGTRYGDKGSMEYEESMRFGNRHFDPDREHMYRADDLMNLPEWSKY